MNLEEALTELRRLEERIHSAEAYLMDPECVGSDRRAARTHLRQTQRDRDAFLRSMNPRASTTGEAGLLAGAAS